MLAAVLGLVPVAFADERIVAIPGAGGHTESDQGKAYVIPGVGVYVETLAPPPPVGERRVVIFGGL